MGCSCNKRRGQAASKGSVKPPTSSAATSANETEKALTASATSARSGSSGAFTLLAPDGRTLSFGSRLEASAARIRLGGGTIRPA